MPAFHIERVNISALHISRFLDVIPSRFLKISGNLNNGLLPHLLLNYLLYITIR